jgi:hypothetical protein
MAHEMDSQVEWQRLYERYHEMSDGELLELAAGIDDLTEVAGDVLRQEMKSRGLSLPTAELAAVKAPAGSGDHGEIEGPFHGDGLAPLITFYDAIEAGKACRFLEAEAVEFAVQDLSEPQSGLRSLEGGPSVSLQLIVEEIDRSRAMLILRRQMGLFPLQEVDVADESVDDGTIAILGGFGRREDADDVAQVLEDAGVWHRIVVNAEGTVEDENCFTLEVREIDMVRAGEVVERAFESELPEG